ncbi:hypothetical protein PQO03_12895 [Lentisphaera profundi]|uniref:PpiC domain-containing protein n=1 Tax=Lentisphaera profundi TaxID=1658616 RepID=A0ABY7VWY0_9BACT|nr:hypothetical protein [Lentisphaera profundi]WDE98733.1 hypothetical protein PQO03_12895 [Lentisphaera profundi]
MYKIILKSSIRFLIFFSTLNISLLPAQEKTIDLKDLNTSLLPAICAHYDGKDYTKTDCLNILRQYLLYYSGATSDANTVEKFTHSALTQYFSFQALFELSRNAGFSADIDEAKKFYENYSSRQNPSKLIEELSLLKLSKQEIVRSIYEKQTIQNYRKELFKSELVGEAEAMLYYYDNPQTFTQEPGITCHVFQLDSPLSTPSLQRVNQLIRQGLEASKALKQQNGKFKTLADQFVGDISHKKSELSTLSKAPLQQFYLIKNPAGHLLYFPFKRIEQSQIAFELLKEKIINSIKSHRVNKHLSKEISQQLNLNSYQLFIDP